MPLTGELMANNLRISTLPAKIEIFDQLDLIVDLTAKTQSVAVEITATKATLEKYRYLAKFTKGKLQKIRIKKGPTHSYLAETRQLLSIAA